ncbi:ATP-dependent helicase/nuclease subunit A [Clostridia bacterium]|nr:ATP-dependent helicase/nuclease subunit A [Clostridia bacterium]
MQFTPQQRQVIELRNRNLLVSAAAGSGKTAVLVERILAKITEGEHPISIDKLLIVTFTHAAAAQMRERICAAIEQRLQAEPKNAHLKRQQALLPHAKITTIHSFCLFVIREFFYQIDLEPDFRMGEEGELKLLSESVMNQVLRDCYEEGTPAFVRLSESLATGKTDQPLAEEIFRLYRFAMSHPWPKEWLKDCLTPYRAKNLEEFSQLPLGRSFVEYLKIMTGEWERRMEYAHSLSQEADGPNGYEKILEEELAMLSEVAECESIEGFSRGICAISFGRLPALTGYVGDPGKKQWVQDCRKKIKDSRKKLLADFFFAEPEEMLAGLQQNQEMVAMLLTVCRRFLDAFAEKKREKNLLDFNDLEHFALDILVEKEGETFTNETSASETAASESVVSETVAKRKPSAAARQLQKVYEEIMIDEYQDSNYVQEMILTAVSGEGEWADEGEVQGESLALNEGEKKVTPKREKRYNRFMVGDVKQSIYRFRMARPELFMEKYETYTDEDNKTQKINLHQNFRSRPEVLRTVNDIFFRIMGRDLGGVEYDTDSALYAGREFPGGILEENVRGTLEENSREVLEENPPETLEENVRGTLEENSREVLEENSPETLEEFPRQNLFDTEILVLDRDAFAEVSDQEQDQEAAVIAVKILQLLKTQTVTDSDSGLLRPMEYKDVVILQRSVAAAGVRLIQVLGEYGIPAVATTGTGYFSALEVSTILHFLRIIDNPRQDIPMAAVLASPIYGITGEEMAKLRIAHRKVPFYQAVFSYGEDGEDLHLRKKINDFIAQVSRFREQVSDTPIHELVFGILEETGYFNYVLALPGGSVRAANLEMLLEKAIAYESTSYKGLFHFVRYIDQLQKYEVDFGEAEEGVSPDCVRIMTIHKSKGLEFPVVFVAGLGKQWNRADERERVVLHPRLGLGIDLTDPVLRRKIPSLSRRILARQTQTENMGEELRVLYVALTRAKEKLILVGSLKKAESVISSYETMPFDPKGHMMYWDRLSTPNAYGWILPALLNVEKRKGRESELPPSKTDSLAEVTGGKYLIQRICPDYLSREVCKEGLMQELSKQELLYRLNVPEPEQVKRVEAILSFTYPYEQDIEMKAKLTVSELKRRSAELWFQEEATGGYLYQEEVPLPYIPAFLEGEQEENLYVLRGNAMHRVLECLDFSMDFTNAKDQLLGMKQEGRLSESLYGLVSLKALQGFLSNPLAKRMQKAAQSGLLYREKPFVMGKAGEEVFREMGGGTMVLIQGIIDAFFEEEGELVLVDYKTDSGKTTEELIGRYRIQMELYQEALERATGKKVKERILYSFGLQEEIRL